MISAKKLIEVARNWKSTAAMRRKRNSYLKFDTNGETDLTESSSVCAAGHFVIYTIDHGQFVLPLAYLGNSIFTALLNKSEEMSGLQSEGPIVLPCEAEFMNYIVLLIQKGLAKEIEKALLSSMETTCSASPADIYKTLLICGY